MCESPTKDISCKSDTNNFLKYLLKKALTEWKQWDHENAMCQLFLKKQPKEVQQVLIRRKLHICHIITKN